MASPSPTLGPLVRMRALTPSQLPSHPKLAPFQTNPSTPLPLLPYFLTTLLTEAHTFSTSYLPTNFTTKSTTRKSSPSTANISLLAHDISSAATGTGVPESWFARRSVHDNESKAGTASWAEFDAGLREDHSVHEKEYTDECLDANQVLTWKTELQAADGAKVGGWEHVTAEVYEMVHKIPAPLKNRAFPVLVVTGRKEGDVEEFVVVQVPVEVRGVEGVKYDLKEGAGKDVVVGMYCSVEHVVVVEGGSKVQWTMGTASDAKGVLPMFLQKMGIPAAVIKDVGLFIGWVGRNRQKQA